MKWWLLFCVLGSFFGSTNCTEETFNKNRIIGGEETPHELFLFLTKLWLRRDIRLEDAEYGHLGLSLNRFKGECSSTIISKRHILTDAHCVVDSGVGQINHTSLVFVDIRPIENSARLYNEKISMKQFGIPSKVYIHRGYHKQTPKYNDIAILEFPEYVDFEIPPVKLAKDYVDDFNDTAIAAGYGRYIYNASTKEVMPGGSPTLRHVKVGIHPFNPNCVPNKYLRNPKKNEYFKKIVNAKHKICAGNPLQRADHGDSGGPLLLERNNTLYQIGLFQSLFVKTEDVAKPAIYTRISSYCGWIEMVTKNEVTCELLPKLPPKVEKLMDENKKGDVMAVKDFCVLLYNFVLNLITL